MLRYSNDSKKYNFQLPTCHGRLNQYGAQSLKNNDSIKAYQSVVLSLSKVSNNNYSQIQQIPLKSKLSKHGHNSLQKGYQNQSALSKYSLERQKSSEKIASYMFKMKQLGLLNPEGRQIKTMRLPGQIRQSTVHNDFHTRETNPGFSRKQSGGGFYVK